MFKKSDPARDPDSALVLIRRSAASEDKIDWLLLLQNMVRHFCIILKYQPILVKDRVRRPSQILLQTKRIVASGDEKEWELSTEQRELWNAIPAL